MVLSAVARRPSVELCLFCGIIREDIVIGGQKTTYLTCETKSSWHAAILWFYEHKGYPRTEVDAAGRSNMVSLGASGPQQLQREHRILLASAGWVSRRMPARSMPAHLERAASLLVGRLGALRFGRQRG